MKEGEIDLLIGSTSYGHLLLYGVNNYGKKYPILQETALGWIMSGANRHSTANTLCLKTQFDENASLDPKLFEKKKRGVDKKQDSVTNDELNDAVKRFWEVEETTPKLRFTEEETIAEEHFLKNVKRHEDGKLIVRLPFKTVPKALGPSYPMAYVRFKQLENKLLRDKEFYDEYKNVINEYIQLGNDRGTGQSRRIFRSTPCHS